MPGVSPVSARFAVIEPVTPEAVATARVPSAVDVPYWNLEAVLVEPTCSVPFRVALVDKRLLTAVVVADT